MNKKNILVIEDDSSILEILKMALEFEGYEVTTAKNGQEGLTRLAQIVKPDLILLDLMMPIMNGWEFREAIRKMPEFDQIPIVVCSAFMEKAKNIECAAFVHKPIELDDLLKTVKENIS
jgi:CheY-like chemotaxis protein